MKKSYQLIDSNSVKNMTKTSKKKDITFFIFVLSACVILFYLPTGFENTSPKKICKARVLSTDNSNVLTFGVVNQGSQAVELEIITGSFSNQKVKTDNILVGDIQIDYLLDIGDKVLIEIQEQSGKIKWVEVIGPDRLNTELLLAVFFILILIAVAGTTGLKAIMSFAFTVLVIWKLFIPCCLKGLDPIWTGLAIVTMITFVISLLVGGWCKKGFIAFSGGFSGILLTCLMAVLFSPSFFLNGAVRPFAKTVLMKVSMDIDITQIFIAGIFIACSGAVMDIAMDISAALCEIKKHHPEISFGQLLRSGLRVGRAVIGTMTTTLLLAYSGGFTTLLMYFMAQGLDIKVMLNSSFLSAEILNTFVGSFGLVMVAPFTALMGSLILTYRKL